MELGGAGWSWVHGFVIPIFYPLPYERTVWYYERANTELIRRTIDQFDWLRALSNVNVVQKVHFFTKTQQLFVVIEICLG